MPRRVVLAAALAGALFGIADDGEARSSSGHRRFAGAPVAVTSPLASAPLRAGETIVLAWEPLPELERHTGIQEWEAFLSLDDGERYPVRLTPHLDLGRRSFAVTLPQFAASRARLLLRFGDEEQEFEYEVPGDFEIRPALQANPEPASLARGRGETARPEDPDDPGVAIWVEGTREGKSARTVVAARSEAGVEAVEPAGRFGLRAATAAPASPQLTAAEPSTHPFTGLFVPHSTAFAATPRSAAIEPRRSTCRQNE